MTTYNRMTAEEVVLARKLAAEGVSMGDIAKEIGKHRTTVTRYIRNVQMPLPPSHSELMQSSVNSLLEMGVDFGFKVKEVPVYDDPQALLLIDAFLLKAESMLETTKGEQNLRTLAEAVNNLILLRRGITREQGDGPAKERPFNLTIKVQRGETVNVAASSGAADEEDDIPDLIDGQLADQIPHEPPPGEPSDRQREYEEDVAELE